MKYDIITILGPTASGKTSLATRLALMMGNAEIISKGILLGMEAALI